ncbi:transposase, partial [Streptomyces sp. NPDC059909]|uniref:transposase n=1 Tax=Streptomyces sp. NPDC059909 TaxID=3346998 RepID=UPI0036484A3C
TCSTTKTSPSPTSPSSNAPQRLDRSTASDVWLTLAATAYNLTRAAGHLASVFHARARTGTIRRHLISVPARIATGARRLTLHLPQLWPWQDDFTDLWTATGQRMVT